jgi:hypothetical protein
MRSGNEARIGGLVPFGPKTDPDPCSPGGAESIAGRVRSWGYRVKASDLDLLTTFVMV